MSVYALLSHPEDPLLRRSGLEGQDLGFRGEGVLVRIFTGWWGKEPRSHYVVQAALELV